MKRLALILLLFASPAFAVTRTVTNDSEMTDANTNAEGGDFVVISAGTYTVGINPTNSGSPGNQIIYYGPAGDPTGVKVPSINVTDYVSVHYVQSNGAIAVGLSDNNDSLITVTMRDTTAEFTWSGDNNYATGLDVRCVRFRSNGTDANFFPVSDWVADNTIEDSQIYASSRSGGTNVVYLRSVLRNVYRRVRWYVRASGTFSDAQLFNQYNVCNTQHYNSFFDLHNGKTGTQNNVKIAFNIRDQVPINETDPAGFLVMQACTLYVTSAEFANDLLFSNGGTEFNVGRNRFDSLLVIEDNLSGGYWAGSIWEHNAENDTLQNSVFVSARRPVVGIAFKGDSALVEHNTFIRAGSSPFSYAFHYDAFFGNTDLTNLSRRNIVWGGGNPTSGLGVMNYNPTYGSQKNTESLYFSPGGDSTLAIRTGSGPVQQSPSAYDTATPDSRWGDPAFAMSDAVLQSSAAIDSIVDWIFVQQRDPFQPQGGSLALWSGWTDGYVGAKGVPESDTVRPDEVSDLVATAGDYDEADLTWTAVGDDSLTGTASSYDIRYSTAEIADDADFNAATQVTGEPVPSVATTSESMTVTGLLGDTEYWFAMKVTDNVGNTSALSNVDTVLTPAAPDVTAPDAVSDLVVSVSGQNIKLDWTGAGDDAGTGTPAGYQIKYSTSEINAGNFDAATDAPSAPSPVAGGSPVTIEYSGFAEGTTYWWALKTFDEVPNYSAVSNSDSTTLPVTVGVGDTIRPAAIDDLSAGAPTSGRIRLTWTAVGDDSLAGLATAYYLSYGETTRTEGNFFDTYLVLGNSPNPYPTFEQEIVEGDFNEGTTYYLAIKTIDDASNFSAISNVATASTLSSDEIPPEDTIDLAASPGDTYVNLTWTSAGDDLTAGTPASYTVRYSTSGAITDANWDSATDVTGEPAAQPGLTPMSMQVTGLDNLTTYWFALKTVDEVPNSSAVSNSPSVTTTEPATCP